MNLLPVASAGAPWGGEGGLSFLISEDILHGQSVCGQHTMLTQPKGPGTWLWDRQCAELKQKSAVGMLSCLVHCTDRLREDEKGKGFL